MSHFISLGANLLAGTKEPKETLLECLTEMRLSGLKVASLSGWYHTPPVPASSGDTFVNAAARIDSHLEPTELLGALLKIERLLGRERHQRWGPRSCDLDLIATEEIVAPSEAEWRRWAELPPDRQRQESPSELILPHPRLQDRAFVLVPLADIAPNWRHPVLGQTVTEMLEALPPQAFDGIERIGS
ncbi:MAG: 2-amino-4-hydroxy-6-hydroxymethyldihydropteridine diphosphokinase [Pseudomonadota bacterium]